MSALRNRRIVLARRPSGVPVPSDFSLDATPVDALKEREFLVRNLFLSVDPAQRGWASVTANYSEPVAVGDVMRALAVGVITESRHADFTVGERLYGWFGWQEFCRANERAVIARVDPANGPDTAALGIFGINGVSAYLALTEIGQPQAGETVVVSTAAGAVGSIVGQIARHLGCLAVGITGSDEKVGRCVSDYGYHAALNYRRGFASAEIGAACPRGVDVFFDNTSGFISDAVWPCMNLRGRIIQCGTAAVASWEPPPTAARHDREVLVKRLRHEGFIIFDHVTRFPAAVAQLAAWVKAGTLRYHEDIEDGLERAPYALAALFQGNNRGKKIIRL
jgi:NADPH-dependent curcumin reductase